MSGGADRAARLRGFFARRICVAGQIDDPAIEAAFATVPREMFLGPAPWFIAVVPAPGLGLRQQYLPTPDADPAYAYQDGLIALDPKRGINNGEPTLHARNIAALGLQRGQRVLHIGCGAGYYTAILAALVGPEGRVDAYEIDPGLAARARRNLQGYSQVAVICGSGISLPLAAADVIYVNAGIDRPVPAWLGALRDGGRLLFPLQSKGGFGGMLLVEKTEREAWFVARILHRAGFIFCEDIAVDEPAGAALKAAFERGDWREVRSLRLDDARDGTCWFGGPGWWLSTAA